MLAIRNYELVGDTHTFSYSRAWCQCHLCHEFCCGTLRTRLIESRHGTNDLSTTSNELSNTVEAGINCCIPVKDWPCPLPLVVGCRVWGPEQTDHHVAGMLHLDLLYRSTYPARTKPVWSAIRDSRYRIASHQSRVVIAPSRRHQNALSRAELLLLGGVTLKYTPPHRLRLRRTYEAVLFELHSEVLCLTSPHAQFTA